MNFQSFLLRQHWLLKDEYLVLGWKSQKGLEGITNKGGYLEPSLYELSVEDFMKIRPIPFGDILQNNHEILTEVLKRSDSECFEELVDRWHQWHVEFAQPISDFGLSPADPHPFGKRLYQNSEEKRLCAETVATTIVHNSDHIVLPEGTSTFWVGLSSLARQENLRLISSNGALIRELLENPVLRKRANSVSVIGGNLDTEVGGTGRGFVGESTQAAYQEAIQRKPGATVVVSSANGLLADIGPFAPCPITGFTRHAVLMHALDSNVRTLVFVSDHSKMMTSRRNEYGDPIFSDKANWQSIIGQHRERIRVVTTPPAEILENSEVLKIRPKDRVIRGNGYSQPTIEYLTTAAAFDELLSVNDGTTNYIEATTTGPADYALT